jgi:RNA polymerase sigma-70 factor, ECF subfamily
VATHEFDDDDARAAIDSDPSPVGPLDVHAFNVVYRETAPLVLRMLRRLVPAEAVEDAAQDVFLTVARRLGDFEGRSRASTWVVGIVIRTAADHRRSRRRADRRHAAYGAEPVDEVRSPEQHAVQGERVRLLHRVLDAMKDEHREVFVLMELEQIEARDVGEHLGLNRNTVYSRLRAARAAATAWRGTDRLRPLRRQRRRSAPWRQRPKPAQR